METRAFLAPVAACLLVACGPVAEPAPRAAAPPPKVVVVSNGRTEGATPTAVRPTSTARPTRRSERPGPSSEVPSEVTSILNGRQRACLGDAAASAPVPTDAAELRRLGTRLADRCGVTQRQRAEIARELAQRGLSLGG